jgi:hypothetical protein
MPQLNENEVIFLLALREVLPYLRQQDDSRLKKRIGLERTQDAADDLAGYIVAGIKEELNRNEKLALSCQLLKCLVRNIEASDIPVTLKTVVDSMGLLSYATEKSFPGYASARLLRYVIIPTGVK